MPTDYPLPPRCFSPFEAIYPKDTLDIRNEPLKDTFSKAICSSNFRMWFCEIFIWFFEKNLICKKLEIFLLLTKKLQNWFCNQLHSMQVCHSGDIFVIFNVIIRKRAVKIPFLTTKHIVVCALQGPYYFLIPWNGNNFVWWHNDSFYSSLVVFVCLRV